MSVPQDVFSHGYDRGFKVMFDIAIDRKDSLAVTTLIDTLHAKIDDYYQKKRIYLWIHTYKLYADLEKLRTMWEIRLSPEDVVCTGDLDFVKSISPSHFVDTHKDHGLTSYEGHVQVGPGCVFEIAASKGYTEIFEYLLSLFDPEVLYQCSHLPYQLIDGLDKTKEIRKILKTVGYDYKCHVDKYVTLFAQDRAKYMPVFEEIGLGEMFKAVCSQYYNGSYDQYY